MKRLVWVLCLFGLLVGCAGREFIARGDELVERGSLSGSDPGL